MTQLYDGIVRIALKSEARYERAAVRLMQGHGEAYFWVGSEHVTVEVEAVELDGDDPRELAKAYAEIAKLERQLAETERKLDAARTTAADLKREKDRNVKTALEQATREQVADRLADWPPSEAMIALMDWLAERWQWERRGI